MNARKILTSLVPWLIVALVIFFGADWAAGRMIHKYLVTHPEVIEEAQRALAKKREVAAALQDAELVRANREALPSPFPEGAAPDDVAVIEFVDYNCSFCKRVAPELARLLSNDPRVRLAMIDYPILGPTSELAAKVALLAAKAGHPEIGDRLLKVNGAITEKLVFEIAAGAGLDEISLRAMIEQQSNTLNAIIEEHRRVARELKVMGTPGFVVIAGDASRIVRRFVDYDGLKAIVADVRADATKAAQR